MAIRGNPQAQAASQAGLANSNTLFGQGQGLYRTLAPQLAQEATNPQGFGPEERARMTTANEQTAGGTNAGITGEAGLIEGRTRNAGGTGMALSRAARETGKNLQNATLGINSEDAQLREQQRQEALRGEQGLYGTDVGAANAGLGETANNANANTEANNASWNWSRYLMAPVLGAAAGSPALTKLIH